MEQIKRYYHQLVSLSDELKRTGSATYKGLTIDSYNNIIDKVSESMDDDYSEYKVPNHEMKYSRGNSIQRNLSWYDTESLNTRLSLVIGMLKSEVGEESQSPQNNPSNLVTLINNNTIGINIQQTITQLSDNEEDPEAKSKLNELNDELKKPKKDWGKIKTILVWIINFSEKLFFAVLPELLKKYN